MGSWFRCVCGKDIHKNIFAGTGISLVVTEAYLDVERRGMSAEDLIDDILLTAPKLLTCKSCGRLVVLHEKDGAIEAKVYAPEAS